MKMCSICEQNEGTIRVDDVNGDPSYVCESCVESINAQAFTSDAKRIMFNLAGIGFFIATWYFLFQHNWYLPIICFVFALTCFNESR